VQGAADGVAEAPLSAAGRLAQRQEPACWPLALEVDEPLTVELVGELMQWQHLIPLVVRFGGVAAGRAGLRRAEPHGRPGKLSGAWSARAGVGWV